MRKTFLVIEVVLCLSLSSLGVSAQDCNRVLEQGIFNQTFIQASESNRVSFQEWQCTTEFRTHDEAINAGVSVGVPIYDIPVQFGGTFSRAEREAWKSNNCNASFSTSDYARKYLEIKRLISGDLLAAWNRCIESTTPRVGLKCSVSSPDNDNLSFSMRYVPVDDEDARRPSVTSSIVTGADVVGAAPPARSQLVPVGTQIVNSATTVPLRRAGTSPVMVVVNTTRGSCEIYLPPPQLSFTVGAMIQPSGEKPAIVSKSFHFDNGTGDDCNRDFSGTETYCVDEAESIRDWTNPGVTSANGPNTGVSPTRRHPTNPKCVQVDWRINGHGYSVGAFGIRLGCKGRGWLVYDVTANGVRWTRENLTSIPIPEANMGNQQTFEFIYPAGLLLAYRNIQWKYSVSLVRRFGLQQTRVQLSDANPAASGVTTRITPDGRLIIDATQMR